jgi:hypothetical protein
MQHIVTSASAVDDDLATAPAPAVVLWRILGNDIVPRHAPGQTQRNLEFILDREGTFPGCEKRFLLNRIMDPTVLAQIRERLEHAGIRYDVIPFERSAYLAQPDAEARVRYITNVNAARNHCVKVGLSVAPFTLPFDGNCFFSNAGWQGFFDVACSHPDAAAFVVPMWRLQDNRHALVRGRRPKLKETVARRLRIWPIRQPVEPQIGFTRTTDVRFDEGLVYSKCPKAELLWRLGVAGPWDRWETELQRDTRARNGSSKYFADRRLIPDAGFVCRLTSGNKHADSSIGHRSAVRRAGLEDLEKVADAACGRP